MAVPDFLGWVLSEKAQLTLAGGMGGAVRWMTLREDWRSGTISVAVGAILSTYLAPLAAPVVQKILIPFTPDPHASSAALSGLIVGLGGITLAGLILDLWRARRRHALERRDGNGGLP